MSGAMSYWRSLWLLFAQAVVVFAAAAFVYALFTRGERPPSYSDAVSRALPSVVSIHGQGLNGAVSNVGSGVIISGDGHILTNYHLIADVGVIEIGLQNGDKHVAEIVGVEPEIDIAVLRINAAPLPAITAAEEDAARLRPGDVVFAIGNPFGLKRSATMGIVSAIGRDRLGLHDLERFIQTDAAINPGNSGGALVGAEGRLVGINSALFYRQHGITPQGIGFAVPADLAMRAYHRLTAGGGAAAENAWGAETRALPPRLRAEIAGVKTAPALVITRVWPRSPAAARGVRAGDIILRVDDARPKSDAAHLPREARQITILRGGDEKTIALRPQPSAQ